MDNSLKIAIVQSGSIHLDVKESLKKALNYIDEAVTKGARLIIFGEAWLSGYPAWLDHCPEVGIWEHPPTKEVFNRMYKNSVQIPGNEINNIAKKAKKHQVVIVMGVNEVVGKGLGNGTIFNSLIIINADGEIANHHRKLMPTYTEKMVYGLGDAHGLKAVQTPVGMVGGLICWEHWMPLTRQAMHNYGEQIHIALWPSVHEMHQIASRHYAFEGRCFVIAVGQIMRAKDIPEMLALPVYLKDEPEKLILNGGSAVIGPDGQYILDPRYDTDELIIAELDDLDRTNKERMTLDVSGHYSRFDIFNFDFKKDRKM